MTEFTLSIRFKADNIYGILLEKRGPEGALSLPIDDPLPGPFLGRVNALCAASLAQFSVL